MIIRNYGLHWKTEDVFWGAQKSSGALYGTKAKNLRSEKIDFRDQSGIYVLYAGFDIVYIGQAGARNQKLFDRLRQHRRDHLAGRWDRFSWFGTRYVLNTGAKKGTLSAEKTSAQSEHKVVLNQLEAVLIATAEPRLNRQGGRFGDKVDQFLQSRDERLGQSTDEMIKEIWEA